MSISLTNILNKKVLVGVSYFDLQGDLLKQQQIAGVVVETDPEKGIAIQRTVSANTSKPEHFVLPTALSCWFKAPSATFTDTETQQQIINPDFLVTWDVYQNQESIEEGAHQWWEWRPRTVPPVVSSEKD